MKVLITGGAGFIGSHLAEELLRRNRRVSVIDDLSTGSIDNIEGIKDHPNFEYVIETINNGPLMAGLIEKCDLVFHLAASVGVKLIVQSPVRTIETNILGTEIVLKLACQKNRKVLLTSTSEVYGKSKNLPYKEWGDLVLGPTYRGRWSYACSKAIDEFLALAYFKEKKLPVVIARLFNTVGPRQTDAYGMVLPTFVKQALRGHPITVYGDGSQSRCFTHVNDVVQALVALAFHPDAVGKVYNIGNTQEITIDDLARLVKDLTGSPSEIVYIPYEEAYEEGFEDMQRRIPDISRIQTLIDYKPTFDIEAIIASLIAFHQTT